jgi:hypothetical protein
MGAGNSSGGGGGRESQSVNQYSQAAKQREEKARQRELAAVKGGRSVVEKEREEFREAGAKKIAEGINTPSLLLNVGTRVLSKPLQAGSRYTRDYFKSEVLGKGAYKGTDVTSFESMSRAAQESLYSDYIGGRTSGRTDAYGREITRGGDGGGAIGTSGQVVQAPQPVTSPTTAEVSQATAADAQESLVLRKRKTLARGRSPTIMTGVTGATGSLTLGKPSLLGR